MKRILSIISIISVATAVIASLTYAAYRLGYCNACDKYIGASECKPKRYLNFLGD